MRIFVGFLVVACDATTRQNGFGKYMKKALYVVVFLWLATTMVAQQRFKSTGNGAPTDGSYSVDFTEGEHHDEHSAADDDDNYIRRKKRYKKSEIVAWRMTDEYLGFTDTVAVDTVIVNFQNNDPIYRSSIAQSYNGNLGSPIQSKIYFDNHAPKTDYLFSHCYDLYTITPKEVNIYNTKTPFSLLTYRTGGASYHEEDYLKGLFTFNVNKGLNVGLLANFIYARGIYSNQSNRLFNGAAWASYDSPRYSCNGTIILNRFNTHENGGIADDRFITNPSEVSGVAVAPENIPTNLTNAYNMYDNDIYYYHHTYRFGSEREIEVMPDSFATEFVPFLGISHTLKFEHARRRYYEDNVINTDFYPHNYLNDTYTNDSTSYLSLKNHLAVNLEEKFNTKLKFGLSAYLQHEWQRHEYFVDTLPNRVYCNNLKVGGAIFKEEGTVFKYNVVGDVVVAGDRIGDFDVHGNFNTRFRIGNDTTMHITVVGKINNVTPTYFLRDYVSNHYKWRNPNFESTIRSGVYGTVSYPNRYVDASVGVNFENITRYVYFDTEALPTQHDGNVQVLSVNGKLNFHAWRFYLENDFAYQHSTNSSVLPLPDFSLFSNLYYKDLFFKVLTVQVGASVRYHTSYYAPTYMPATGQFYNQNTTLIGNYPFLSAYVNCHLKKVRFFIQVHNLLASAIEARNYFSMPSYPMSQLTVRFGLSWAFYD